MLIRMRPNTVADAMKRPNTKRNTTTASKPVDQEFLEFLTDSENLKILKAAIRTLLPDWVVEDPEDIISEIFLKYLRPGAMRPPILNRKTLFTLANRQVVDFIRRRRAVRRGSGAHHVSIDDEDSSEWVSALAVEPCETALSLAAEQLLGVLNEAELILEGKQLTVVQALIRWIRKGFPSESWCDEFTPRQKKEFLKLKKGKSLEGKASATFSKVKGILREIVLAQGLGQN